MRQQFASEVATYHDHSYCWFHRRCPIIWSIGVIVLLIGLVFMIFGALGHAIGGWRHVFQLVRSGSSGTSRTSPIWPWAQPWAAGFLARFLPSFRYPDCTGWRIAVFASNEKGEPVLHCIRLVQGVRRSLRLLRTASTRIKMSFGF